MAAYYNEHDPFSSASAALSSSLVNRLKQRLDTAGSTVFCDDLEREGYAVGACGLPAASVGAFHIRQRLWFVAHAERRGLQARHRGEESSSSARVSHGRDVDGRCGAGALDDTERERAGRSAGSEGRAQRATPSGGQDEGRGQLQALHAGPVGIVGHASAGGFGELRSAQRHAGQPHESITAWSHCEWLECRDGKARPVEPGTFPLAHGVPARVGRLRGYGNAIVPELAQVFIEAYMSLDRLPAALPQPTETKE